MTSTTEIEAAPGPDDESRAWVAGLRGPEREEVERRLHDLLLRAARTEIARRKGLHPHLRGGDLDDLAHQAANDALVAIIAKLGTYRGQSRFTTWAYKFALLEAAVKLRLRAWQGLEVPVEPEQWGTLASPERSPSGTAESHELLSSISAAIESELSPRQRQVLVAVAIEGVPIDVLAERLDTTRGALYKTIHDARRKLRSHLAATGLRLPDDAFGMTEPRR